MALAIGIVGLPNVGKSTLFNALTKNSVPAENYPFCTIDPSVGLVPVPDDRLEKLSKLSESQKTIPAVCEFVDIAGLVKGASAGEGLGNQFLSHIREVNAIAHMVRIFEDGDITHVDGSVDPLRDISVINLELIMADLQTVQKRRNGIAREVKRGVKEALAEDEVLQKLEATLDNEKLARSLDFTDAEMEIVRHLHLLTMKDMLYVLNKKHDAANVDEKNDGRWEALVAFFEETKATYTFVDAGLEHELMDMDSQDREAFKRDLGVEGSGVEVLIQKGYDMLGLMTYFTTGPEETRGWTVKKGSTAPVAAAAIHTDFQQKFIRAEVIETDKLLEAGSSGAAREKGWLRIEGKEYIVQDGDVIHFRI